MDYADLFDKVSGDTRFNDTGPTIMQRKDEIIWLLELVNMHGGADTAIEIGSLHGANLVLLGQVARSVISIDPELEGSLKIDVVREYIGDRVRHYKIGTGDPDIVNVVNQGRDPDPLVVVVLDAVHKKDEVIRDFGIATILAPNSIIAIHDIVKSEVKEAWAIIKRAHSMYLECVSEDSKRSKQLSGDEGWGGFGVIRYKEGVV